MASPQSGLFADGPIPDRVAATVPLKIITSNIPNAGRGLAVTAPVKAGELIFSIPDPLLSIVSLPTTLTVSV